MWAARLWASAAARNEVRSVSIRMELAIVVVVWIFCGIAAAFIAQNRGASGCLWFGLGVLFGPFGLAFAFAAGKDRSCPACKKRIHPDATKCQNCQTDLTQRLKFRCSECKADN